MSVKPYDTASSKKEEVRGMFDRIARRYDLLNRILSLGIDRLWRRRVVEEVRRVRPARILDLATGTGDLAISLARRIPAARISGVDLSEKMLAEARRKVGARGLADRISLECGDAEHLAAADGSFDVATVAFGVRNFGDPDAGLREMARVLRPGGKVVVLEFSRPRNPFFRFVYEFYTFRILPLVGGAVSRDRKAYAYLPASVRAFPAPEEFVGMLVRAGFPSCRTRSLSFGVAHIYIGEKAICDPRS